MPTIKYDDNFITIFCAGRIIIICKDFSDWGYISIGDRSATGHLLTQAEYDRLESEN